MNKVTKTTSNNTALTLVLLLAMVLIGALSRVWMVEFPNIKPVAALALFAGFYFARVRLALIGVVAMMVVSDLWLGVYDWKLALFVYGAMGLACGLGWFVSRSTSRDATEWKAIHAGKVGVASLAMSTLFFALTNFGCWLTFGYEQTLAGLAECFTLALPFYRSTLTGDLLFTGLIFGGYWAVCTINARIQESKLVKKKIS